MISTVDPDARHIHKNRTRHQDGFKGHVSFEPGEQVLFTAAALTGGSGAANHEAAVAAGLLASEEELTVLGDTAYGTGELRERLQADGHAAVIKPPPLRQAIPGGFTIDDFTIDDQASTAACPSQCTPSPWATPQRRRQPPGPVQGAVPRLLAARSGALTSDHGRPLPPFQPATP